MAGRIETGATGAGRALVHSRPRSSGLAGAMAVALAALPGVPAVAADAPEPAARFRIDASLRPLVMSACGRFVLDARASHAPEAKSADGRFALKAVHVPSVGCDPNPDALFSNGFEP